MTDIKIIIMTESSKNSGKSVAGIDVSDGKWVRLVSSDKEAHGAISDDDLVCEDDSRCGLLDVVKVSNIKECGNDIQPENVLIDRDWYIEIERKATLHDVLRIHPAEMNNDILGNKYSYITDAKVTNIGY
jgi:hypothetical protein